MNGNTGARGGVQPGSTSQSICIAATAWSIVALISFVGIHSAGPAADARRRWRTRVSPSRLPAQEEYLRSQHRFTMN